MNPLIVGMLLSLAPISELRGGIPYAIAKGINPWLAFTCCAIANIIAIIVVFLFLELVHRILLKIPFYRKKVDKIRNGHNKSGFFMLTVLAAIPLPVIGGAWTAALIAWVLGLNKMKSFLAIAIGTVIAGIITTLATIGIIKLFF
ncbi:MAG: small multi-drug export protein [Candidatus Paceibacterota bacterium]